MRSIHTVHNALRSSYDKRRSEWFQGEFTSIGFTLNTPTEKDVLADMAQTRAWVNSWTNYKGRGQVQWVERQWSTVGRQCLPESISFERVEDVIQEIGAWAEWSVFATRVACLTTIWPILKTSQWLYGNFGYFAQMSELDFSRLSELVQWLQANPVSNCYLRELPVTGIDTKWIEKRKPLILCMMRAIGMSVPDGVDIETALGLKRVPARIRIRLLCPKMQASHGGVDDLEVPIATAERLCITPRMVIIVENQTTGLALPAIDGAVAIMSMGYGITGITTLPWLRTAPLVLYWGDIDTDGMSMLNLARKSCPTVKSFLMSGDTWEAFKAFHVGEDGKKAASTANMELLTAGELAMMQHLLTLKAQGAQNTRLEQEKISWVDALRALHAEIDSTLALPA